MKNYTYTFIDGAKNIVEVDDTFYTVLTEMDKKEHCGNRRERRRRVSLESLVEANCEPVITDNYFANEAFTNMENERLQIGILSLLPSQRQLLYRVFYERLKIKEIAQDDGITVCSVSKKLSRIYKKLKNFL